MSPIGEAIRYPMDSEDWKTTILIGGGLVIFSFLVIPGIIAAGYVVKVIQSYLKGSSGPPTFDDWGALLVDGVQAWIIGFVYMLVPSIVAAVTVGGSIISIMTGSRAGATAGIAGLFGGLALWFVLSLIFGYVAVAGIVNFAREDEIGSAFDFGTIRGIVTSSEFAVGWVLGVVVMIAAAIVVGVLNVVPILGFIIGAFVNFYAIIVAATLWTEGFTDALEAGTAN